MGKWVKTALCIVLAVASVTVTEYILNIFKSLDYALDYPVIEKAEIVDLNGEARGADTDPEMAVQDIKAGESLRMSLHLPTAEELPALYDEGYISYFSGRIETVFFIDGQEVLRTANRLGFSDFYATESQLPVMPEWAGAELTILISPLDPGAVLSADDVSGFTYMIYFNFRTEYGSMYALSNRNAIPAGAYALIFIIVIFFFLVSVFLGKPNWSLMVLALMAGLTFFWYLCTYFGYYFLSDAFLAVLDKPWLPIVILGLATVYLLLNMRLDFWRRLGIVLLASVGCAGLMMVCLHLLDSDHAWRLLDEVLLTLRGEVAPMWLIPYMTILCGGTTLYGNIRDILAARSEARALAIRQSMLSDNYRVIEQRFADTAMLRHDWKNQLTALNLLYKEGEIDKLGQRLQELDSAVDSLRLPAYSQCFVINAILQNASSRAYGEGIEFHANAPLPERVEIDEGDMCSFFINMLDNALEAAAKVPEGKKRFIDLTVRINQGFLAVCCRNSCPEDVEMAAGGFPKTTKSHEEGHGLGLRQMEQIAKKYGSKLDLSCDGGVFTVQTALKLKKAAKKAPAAAGAK